MQRVGQKSLPVTRHNGVPAQVKKKRRGGGETLPPLRIVEGKRRGEEGQARSWLHRVEDMPARHNPASPAEGRGGRGGEGAPYFTDAGKEKKGRETGSATALISQDDSGMSPPGLNERKGGKEGEHQLLNRLNEGEKKGRGGGGQARKWWRNAAR